MDDKVKKILELQEQGVPRKEIYKIMEYKEISSLNRFMKRRGFSLVGELFVKNEAPIITTEDDKDNYMSDVQDLIEKYNKITDEKLKEKETDLLTV